MTKQLKRVYIEITNICNLSCSFCPKTLRKPEFMNLNLFEKILEDIKPYTKYVYLHVKGEPFLHPELAKILSLTFKYGFKTNITTNGVLINDVKDKIILKPSLRQINFSLHSFDGNKNSTNKEKYIKDIISFTKEALEKTNIIISLRLWNLDKDNTTNLSLNKNRDLLEIIEKEFALDYKIDEELIEGKGIKISKNLYLNYDHEFKWPDLNDEIKTEKGFCYALRDHAAILVDGTVIPCCLDGEGIINLGNVLNNTFSEIINNDRSKKIYDGFSNNKAEEELCKKCQYKEKFKN